MENDLDHRLHPPPILGFPFKQLAKRGKLEGALPITYGKYVYMETSLRKKFAPPENIHALNGGCPGK